MKSDSTSGCILTLLALPVAMIWSGWVVTVLWGWFVAPLFGLPPLDLAPAIGLALIVGYMTTTTNVHQKTEMGEAIATALFRPAFALLIGWIVQLFIR